MNFNAHANTTQHQGVGCSGTKICQTLLTVGFCTSRALQARTTDYDEKMPAYPQQRNVMTM